MAKLDTARCALSVLLVVGACATPVAREAPAPARAVDTVSIAYGRVPRDHLTGAVSSLTEEDIASARATRVVELFQGRVAGVQVLRGPNGNLTLRIRGAQGLGYSDDEPLVVIDGMPAENTGWSSVLDALMPQDITRIDVLKDAGSTAAYGLRGANGVILITTKRGNP